MDEDTKREREPEGQGQEGPAVKGIQTGGWKVTDEEIDRVIKKLEEGWGF
jgi:hypothetical protein